MSELSTTGLLSSFYDTSKPNMARVFNYMLDGSYHFEVDRQAAAQMMGLYPGIRRWVQVRYAFVLEAFQLLLEQGFQQFLDLGSGIPTEDLTYFFPEDVRVVFCDVNPVAVSYGQSLFEQSPDIEYIHGDVRYLDAILESPAVQRLIHAREKVAIGLNGIPAFISQDDCRILVERLYTWAPAGSKLFFTLQTREHDATFLDAALKRGSNATGFNLQLYTKDEAATMLSLWQVDRLEAITQFLGLPDSALADIDKDGSLKALFQAGFYVK